MRKTQLPERTLDAVRAFALTCVVADHTLVVTLPARANYDVIAAVGTFGFLLFFLHTAVVLLGSLERQNEHPGWVRTFYLRRAFRIYPLAILAVLVMVVAMDPAAGSATPRGFAPAPPRFDAATIASNLALVQNLAARRSIIGPMWTLPVELDMYLLLPLCFLMAKRSAWHVAALFVAFGLGYECLAHPLFPELRRLTVFAYGPCFLAGVLTYYCCRRETAMRLPSWTIAPLLAAGYAWMYLVFENPHQPLRWVSPIIVGTALPFIRPPEPSRLTRLCRMACQYSYGIYLVHVPVLWMVTHRMGNAPAWLRALVAMGAISGLAFAGYHLVEKPGIDFGRRVTDRAPDPCRAIHIPPLSVSESP